MKKIIIKFFFYLLLLHSCEKEACEDKSNLSYDSLIDLDKRTKDKKTKKVERVKKPAKIKDVDLVKMQKNNFTPRIDSKIKKTAITSYDDANIFALKKKYQVE